MIMKKLVEFLIIISLVGYVFTSSKPVSIRDKATGQLVTSSLLTWESYNSKGDIKQQFENAIAGGNFTGADKNPVYICRSTIDAVQVTGFVIKHSDTVFVCMISLHENVRTKPEFDIISNKGNGAKLEWGAWEKLIPFTQGFNGAAVSGSAGTRSEIFFIGRHKINHTTGHNEIDHAIGYFNPNAELGKIYAIHENREKSFESGEILVSIEAARYELKNVKFNSPKLRESKTRIQLGQTILKNEGNEESDVNAVIGYEHEIIRNFGTHEGIARSVNTTVFMSKTDSFSFFWGIQKNEKELSSKTVGTRLKPGTAVNVTLWANYTTKEGPYDGQLVIFYVDGTESKRRKIFVSSGYEANLENQLETEYSETYFLHNDTIVPTTTKRTTTTSSSTYRSVFPSINNEQENIAEKAQSLSNQNFITETDDQSYDGDEKKNDINNSSIAKFASTTVLVIGLFLANLYDYFN